MRIKKQRSVDSVDYVEVIQQKGRTTMFEKTTKAIVAALVLTSVSFAAAARAYSAPQQAPSQAEQAWMNRASNPNTNGY